MNGLLYSASSGVLWVVDPPPPPLPPLVAMMVYAKGNYQHALHCFEDANKWAQGTGGSTLPGFKMLIFPPHHKKSPWHEKVAPFDLLDDPGWSIRIKFHADQPAREWLRTQRMPPNARFFWLTEKTAP